MFFSGFARGRVEVPSEQGPVSIPYVMGGQGPPLLLLHGFPQTHIIWHRAAPRLAESFTVVATDLRGYGDASKPPSSRDHAPYSKRAMAGDQFAVMRQLGFERFFLCGHDRGGRVAHRLAADHEAAVRALMVLDIAPTLAMYEQTNLAFASAYWHWFFLIQPEPLPERMIGADAEFTLRQFMGSRHAGLKIFHPDAWSEYVRCAANPETLHAMCEDYRAAATIDLEHDRADRDAGRKLAMPVRVLWGRHGVVHRCFQPVEEWRRVARKADGESLDCGHYLPEEVPDQLVDQMARFFQ